MDTTHTDGMNDLQKKIAEYMDNYTVKHLCSRAGVQKSVIYRIMQVTEYSDECFEIRTLQKLYSFFNLQYDDWYKSNLRKHYPATPGVLGDLIRDRRIEKWYSQEYIADRAKLDKRVIVRLEMGYTLPSINTYTLSTILSLLDMSPDEQKVIQSWVQVTRQLTRIQNKGIEKGQNDDIYTNDTLFTASSSCQKL